MTNIHERFPDKDTSKISRRDFMKLGGGLTLAFLSQFLPPVDQARALVGNSPVDSRENQGEFPINLEAIGGGAELTEGQKKQVRKQAKNLAPLLQGLKNKGVIGGFVGPVYNEKGELLPQDDDYVSGVGYEVLRDQGEVLLVPRILQPFLIDEAQPDKLKKDESGKSVPNPDHNGVIVFKGFRPVGDSNYPARLQGYAVLRQPEGSRVGIKVVGNGSRREVVLVRMFASGDLEYVDVKDLSVKKFVPKTRSVESAAVGIGPWSGFEGPNVNEMKAAFPKAVFNQDLGLMQLDDGNVLIPDGGVRISDTNRYPEGVALGNNPAEYVSRVTSDVKTADFKLGQAGFRLILAEPVNEILKPQITGAKLTDTDQIVWSETLRKIANELGYRPGSQIVLNTSADYAITGDSSRILDRSAAAVKKIGPIAIVNGTGNFTYKIDTAIQRSGMDYAALKETLMNDPNSCGENFFAEYLFAALIRLSGKELTLDLRNKIYDVTNIARITSKGISAYLK